MTFTWLRGMTKEKHPKRFTLRYLRNADLLRSKLSAWLRERHSQNAILHPRFDLIILQHGRQLKKPTYKSSKQIQLPWRPAATAKSSKTSQTSAHAPHTHPHYALPKFCSQQTQLDGHYEFRGGRPPFSSLGTRMWRLRGSSLCLRAGPFCVCELVILHWKSVHYFFTNLGFKARTAPSGVASLCRARLWTPLRAVRGVKTSSRRRSKS